MSQYIHGFDSANKRVKPINTDENGNLQVDVVSMTGGGDATAANQTTNHSKLDTLATNITSTNTKLDSAITKLTEIDTVLDSINSGSGASGNLEGIRQAILSDLQGKLDHLSDDVDGLEALQTSTNTKLDHLSDDIDGVDTLITSTNSKLDTLDGSVNTIEGCVSANKLAVSHGALTELESALNSNKLDVNIASQTGQDTMASSVPVVLASNHSSIPTTNAAIEPTLSQATLASSASILSGASTSEIDMNGFKHLTVYGSSDTNFGSFILARRSTSGGSNFLDGQNMMSASDPTGGTSYHFSATFRDVGNRYIAFQNTSSGTQVVSLFVVKHR